MSHYCQDTAVINVKYGVSIVVCLHHAPTVKPDFFLEITHDCITSTSDLFASKWKSQNLSSIKYKVNF